MFACLPWYDFPELAPATDALWERVAGVLADAGIHGVPGHLNRRLHYEDQWDSGELLLGQACGYDVAIAFAHQLKLVATPVYDLPGCHGPTYRSFVVVREDDDAQSLTDLRGRRCVINTPTSHSGANVLRSLVAPLSEDGKFFEDATVSGAHEKSLKMLRDGGADVAAIDCVTWGLLESVRPDELQGMRIIHRTVRVAAPPYVTSTATPSDTVDVLQRALQTAAADADLAGPLSLSAVALLDIDDYGPIVDLERLAAEHGYDELPRKE